MYNSHFTTLTGKKQNAQILLTTKLTSVVVDKDNQHAAMCSYYRRQNLK